MTEETTEVQPEASDETPKETTPEVTTSEEATPEEANAEPTAEVVEDDAAAAGLTLGSGAPAEEDNQPQVDPVIRGKIDRFGAALGTGRRKTSVARVRVKSGSGVITVNGRPMEEYFTVIRDRKMILAPLLVTGEEGKVDVWIRASGGGITGQTGAAVLGIARALQAKDASNHHALAEGGFLTRDDRMVERKKYGLKKARKSFQFSKR
ncbi:30S ribosomal protein S9 [Polystyrenella longa]|uniref:Small ribosomal subunit protein uS9 n=1 Tax=Polystyrenella longa TaxID=2528007 RepID=A0A518CJS8_9PLAN|nr:30S ribosomal protein S9 [Polystyrenella longa]